MAEYDASAKYINCALAPERRIAEDVTAMFDRKTARWMTLGGAVAALLSGLGSMLIALFPAFSLSGFGAALLFIGLGVGIYLNSRACAVGALLYFVTMRFAMYPQAAAVQSVQGGNVMVGFWTSVLLFTVLYASGVAGTFATASLEPTEPRAAGSETAPPNAKTGSSDALEPPPSKTKAKREKVPRVRGLCGACSGVGKLPDTDLPCAWCDGKGYV